MELLKKCKLYTGLLIVIAIVICSAIFVIGNRQHFAKVYNYKAWDILFSKPLSEDEIRNFNVAVLDGSKNKQSISLNWISNDEVLVNPPQTGYKTGQTYAMNISTKLDFKLDRRVPNKKNTSFTILSSGDKKAKVIFEDKNLETAVRNAINKPEGELTKGDVESLDSLVATSSNISNLSGIENLVNLRMLMLDVNNIEDIRPLEKLMTLQRLGLSHNNISDIKPLKKLSNLLMLSLDGNPVDNYKVISNITKHLEWKDYNNK